MTFAPDDGPALRIRSWTWLIGWRALSAGILPLPTVTLRDFPYMPRFVS